MRETERIRLQLFARRGGRNYMMRSQKRPSYNSTPRPRPARRRRTHYGYLVLTLLVAILLWPVGLFLIWNRRLRCGVGGKLLWSVATLLVFSGLVLKERLSRRAAAGLALILAGTGAMLL